MRPENFGSWLLVRTRMTLNLAVEAPPLCTPIWDMMLP
jgi:hypothetical protein